MAVMKNSMRIRGSWDESKISNPRTKNPIEGMMASEGTLNL